MRFFFLDKAAIHAVTSKIITCKLFSVEKNNVVLIFKGNDIMTLCKISNYVQIHR